jgi:parvulin-like peptidyl-prolyl isomerase
VRASHILLKTEGKDEAAVKTKAEEILKEAKGGADFAELAKKNSEDESNAKNGGDLDYFGRGRMVPEFDAAAFNMETGQISDLVKTQFGFHIIKLTDKKAGTTRSLDEVKQQLTDQVQSERAQQQAGDLAQKLEAQIKKPADLETAAKGQRADAAGNGFLRQGRADPRSWPGTRNDVSGVHDERRRCLARHPNGTRLRLRDRHRKAGLLRPQAR